MDNLIKTYELYEFANKYFDIFRRGVINAKNSNKEPEFCLKDDIGDFCNWLVFRNALRKLGISKSVLINNFIKRILPNLLDMINENI